MVMYVSDFFHLEHKVKNESLVEQKKFFGKSIPNQALLKQII